MNPVPTAEVVMMTPVLSSSNPDNAGTRYVHEVYRAIANRRSIVAVAPDGPAARRAMAQGGTPSHFLMPEERASRRANALRRVREVLWPLGFSEVMARAAGRPGPIREALRSAAAIDLQWEEQVAIIPQLRRLNPEARIVCTVHDVLTQRYARARDSAENVGRRTRWAWAALTARWAEARLMNLADVVVVLSEKDARLLPKGSARVAVVTPPLGRGAASRTERARGPELLLVSMLARWENEEGLLWFLDEVLPLIRREVPDVRFRVAGLGIRPHVAEAAANAGIELLGFVDDLEPLYDEAAAVVVPLRLGAGVKFKVVDALVRGVPVVTTPVGAEGIGTDAWFAGVHGDAAEFAAAVVEVLTNPDPAERRAAAARTEALGRFGQEQFEQSMREIYG